MLRSEPLRNPAITAALEGAFARRSYGDLFALLCRFSGLPGPRPNDGLAWSVGQAVAAQGARADGLIRELCSMNPQRAPPRSVTEFLPIVGVYCLAARFVATASPEIVLAELRTMAEDPRHLVRHAVVGALAEMSRTRGEELVKLLAAWTDGYLSASVALEAFTSRSWLDDMRLPDELLLRLDEAFSFAEAAPRADQRSQGYRTLVKTLSDAPVKVIDRFPGATLAWLESRASTSDVELRDALRQLVRHARAAGHTIGKLEGLEQKLDASAPPRRDPKTYVGPTRQRGARRR